MAHISTDHSLAHRAAQHITARLSTAWRALADSCAIAARANAAAPLLDATPEDLRARGLTRADVMDYILNGRTRS